MRDKPRAQIPGACVAGVQGKNISMGEVEARGVQIFGGVCGLSVKGHKRGPVMTLMRIKKGRVQRHLCHSAAARPSSRCAINRSATQS